MYTKLFSSLTNSTIWREEDHVRLVWITLLAMSDKFGHVMSSVPGLADQARVSLEKTVEALKALAEPDEWSRSKEHEGRRIREIGGGWELLNYTKYAKIRDEEERKEYMRKYMRDYRKQRVNKVSNVNSSKPRLAHTDTDTDIKSRKGGGVLYPLQNGNGSNGKHPPSLSQFKQTDFDERDWRKLSEAKRKIVEWQKGRIGCEPMTEAEFWEAVAEDSGLTLQRINKLQQTCGQVKQ